MKWLRMIVTRLSDKESGAVSLNYCLPFAKQNSWLIQVYMALKLNFAKNQKNHYFIKCSLLIFILCLVSNKESRDNYFKFCIINNCPMFEYVCEAKTSNESMLSYVGLYSEDVREEMLFHI